MKKLSTRTRVATGAAAVVVVGAGVVGAVSASAETPNAAPAAAVNSDVQNKNTFQSTHLTVEAATKAAQASLDAAAKAGQKVAVAVVDRNGNVIVELRGDGSGPQAFESAERKAYTAVSWNAPTSELVKRLAQAPNLKDIPGTLFLGGGAPVQVKGAPIAGIGVAGAPSGDQDEQFAQAGVDALNK
ncbi:GlcG/HbpS family heme-binding protein [Kitasatospora phosalacinea]|uniref:GlcG/HbpS family heme-binding protein n=1 Tax=Kitasatospora phosalacinea TaxID=2065 RepID=UPI0005260990|nr:heme-binding protein [Kitasatospora phosalacinea]